MLTFFTEALALTWAVEHSLRANRNFGRKLLFLADNLPLVLSAGKGRGKSSHLTKPFGRFVHCPWRLDRRLMFGGSLVSGT